MKAYTQAELIALEASQPTQRGIPYEIWCANRINSLFESRGVKGDDGRGASASDIRPETIRHGQQTASV